MSRLADGLTRRNAKKFLSAFDAAHFSNYPLFADRIAASLNRSDSVRVYYRVSDAAEENGSGTAAVEFQLERTVRSSGSLPVRKRSVLRFECLRGEKGWRIVNLEPRDFFTVD